MDEDMLTVANAVFKTMIRLADGSGAVLLR
jgi:hypothetical protein